MTKTLDKRDLKEKGFSWLTVQGSWWRNQGRGAIETSGRITSIITRVMNTCTQSTFSFLYSQVSQTGEY